MNTDFLVKQSMVHPSTITRLVEASLGGSRSTAVTAITDSDRELYAHFFASDGRIACYGNSWTYITQACRGVGSGLGLKYYDGDMLLSIGYHKGHYILVRPLGEINARIIAVLDALHSVTGRPVFLKKVFPDEAVSLRALGEFEETRSYVELVPEDCLAPRSSYVWDVKSPSDDDTYPEMVLDVDLTSNYTVPPKQWATLFQMRRKSTDGDNSLQDPCSRYDKFRGKVNRFVRLGCPVHLVPYDTSMADEVYRFLRDHFGDDDEQNAEAYENMLRRLPLGNNGHSFVSFVALVVETERPVGFFVTERLDQESAGLYAAVASREFPGLSEFLHLQMLRRLKNTGVRLLNMGGSEVRSLHDFKCKFAPVEERRMAMLVYRARY